MSTPPFPPRSDHERHRTPPLDRVIAVLCQVHGCDLSPFEESFLIRSLERRIELTAAATAADYLQRLADDRAEAGALIQSLQIGYSDFFRDPLAFSLLERLILPSLVEAKAKTGSTEVRVWSAGCAAGQEAWSVAILLDDLAAARGGAIPYRVIATDVSEAAVAAARRGVYDRKAVQNLRLRHLQNCFSPEDESYAVLPRIRDRVDFSTYDLLDERSFCPPVSLYGDFDLILCCNLLFYYRPAVRQIILDKVGRALTPGGYFVTGEAEREIVAGHDGLRPVAPPAAVFQMRGKP